jgi:uncharacterized protein YlxP (DUF503 family)
VIVALARLSLYIPHSHSLKEKRAVVRKVVDRIAARFKMHVAEVGGQDTWQRAVLGFAAVGADAQRVGQLADEVVRAIQGIVEGEGQLIAVDRDTIRFGGEDGLPGGIEREPDGEVGGGGFDGGT